MHITADTSTDTRTSTHTDAVAGTAPAEQPRTGARDADGMAVASFVLGLLGLLVLNLFLGPVAIVLMRPRPVARHRPPWPCAARTRARRGRPGGPRGVRRRRPHGVLEPHGLTPFALGVGRDPTRRGAPGPGLVESSPPWPTSTTPRPLRCSRRPSR